MSIDNIYIGDINKCTKYKLVSKPILDEYSGDTLDVLEVEEELFKEKTILIKTNTGYIDIDNIKNDLDLYISNLFNINKYKGDPTHTGELYVDELSLRKYKSVKNKLKIKELKK